MNIDLTPLFKVVLILYVVAALKLKSITYFFTALVFSNIILTLLNSINKVFGSNINLNLFTLVKVLLFGDQAEVKRKPQW